MADKIPSAATSTESTKSVLDQQVDDLQDFLTGPTREGGEQEPDIRGGDEPPPGRPEGAPQQTIITPTEPVADERLAQAIRTIDNLTNKVQELERGLSTTIQQRQAGGEPVVEYEEVFRGIRLPKDISKWPIRITAEEIERAGWNDDPARAINVLANAFFTFIQDSLVPSVRNSVLDETGRAVATGRREQQFYTEFPDLKSFGEFLPVFEAGFRQANAGRTIVGDDYGRGLGQYARERIANMRGVSVEQYVASLQAGVSPPTAAPSRARTTSGAGRTTGGSRLTDQQREMQDMMGD